MLSVQAPSTHNALSLPNCTAATTELSPACMKQGSVQVAGTEDSYAYLHPKLVKCVTAVTEQCVIQRGGGKLCMVSLYLGLLTHIHCRVTKRNINP